MRARTRHQPVFVGRLDELVAARQAILASRRVGLTVLEVVGDGGIGKTTLVEHAMAREFEPTTLVSRLRCSDRRTHPGSDLFDFLAPLVGGDRAAPLVAQVTRPVDLSAGPSLSEFHARRGGALSQVADAVLEAIGARPTVLLVDDLHWATPLQLELLDVVLDELLATVPERAVTLLLVRRTLPPGHAVSAFLQRLRRLLALERLELGPLRVEDEEDLVRRRAGMASRAFVDLVRRSSGGNPLRSLATVDALLRRGVEAQLDAGDRRAHLQVRLPPGELEDPVATWLAELDPGLLSTLRRCALLPREFEAADAAAAVAGRLDQVEPALDAAVDLEVLGTDGRAYWFAHTQYRQLLEGLLSTNERRAVHLRCVRHLQQVAESARSDDHRIALGGHALHAGGALSAEDRWAVLCSAGDAASAAALWSEAARFYEAALAGDAPGAIGDRAAVVRLRAGQAHFFNHDERAAVTQLRIAIAMARASGDEHHWSIAVRTLTRLANTMHANAYREIGDLAEIQEFLEEARDPVERAVALEVLAEAHSAAGRSDTAVTYAQEAIALLEGSGNHRALALCHYAWAYSSLSVLRLREAVAVGRHALDHAARSGDWFVPLAIKARLAYAHFGSGDLGGAESLATEAIEAAAAHREYAGQALGHTVLCAIAMLHGDLVDAEHHAQRAAAATRRSGHASAAYHLAPLRVGLLLSQGQVDAAAEELEAWPGLPAMVLAPYRTLVDVELGRTPAPSSRPPRHRATWIGSGIFAAEVAAAMAVGDVRWLEAAGGELRGFLDQGLVATLSYPASAVRLFGDARRAVGRHDEAAEAYDRAVAELRRLDVHAELARALLGLCRSEAMRTEGSGDAARRAGVESHDLALRLGLTRVEREATAFLRRGIDLRETVGQRSQGWRVILVTDVVGSTDICRRLGDVAYHQLVSAHHNLVRACVDHFEGTEFSDSGDGLYSWFTSTEAAVAAAMAVQDAAVLRGPAGPGLAIKVSLAGGEPLMRDGRPFGLVVNRAARLVDVACGGEVVADEAVAADLGTTPVERRADVTLRGLGLHTMTWLNVHSVESSRSGGELTRSATSVVGAMEG